MRTEFVHRYVRLATFVILAAIPSSFSTNAAEVERVLFEDRFQEKVGDGWSWLYEDPSAWRIKDGKLQINATGGSPWQNNRDGKNFLLRKPPEWTNGDLAIELFAENRPKKPFEHIGVMWYYDDDNYVTLNKEEFGGKQVVLFVVEKEGKGRPPYGEIPYQGEGIWLRLRLTGKKILAQFRATPQDEWQLAGSRELEFPGIARIGLHAGYASKNDKDHWCSFSNFRVLQITNE